MGPFYQMSMHGLHSLWGCAGKIHFVKFETQRIDECIDFIEAKGLHRTHKGNGEPDGRVRIVATGGGAFKYADKFEVWSCLSAQQAT